MTGLLLVIFGWRVGRRTLLLRSLVMGWRRLRFMTRWLLVTVVNLHLFRARGRLSWLSFLILSRLMISSTIRWRRRKIVLRIPFGRRILMTLFLLGARRVQSSNTLLFLFLRRMFRGGPRSLMVLIGISRWITLLRSLMISIWRPLLWSRPVRQVIGARFPILSRIRLFGPLIILIILPRRRYRKSGTRLLLVGLILWRLLLLGKLVVVPMFPRTRKRP